MKLTKKQEEMIALINKGETKGYNLNSLEALIRKGLVKTVRGNLVRNNDGSIFSPHVYTHVVTKGNGWNYKTMEVLETFEKTKQELIKEGWIVDSVYGFVFKLNRRFK